MKIAFFGDTSYAGTRDWLAYLAGQEDFDVHAIDFPAGRRGIDGVTFHTLEGPQPTGKLRYFACVPALRRLLRSLRPDLLIGYRVVSYGFSASMTGFHPLVLAAQGRYIVSKETPAFFRIFARRAVRRADLIHAWAPPMAESLEGLGADPARIITLTRGVDDEIYRFEGEPPPPLTLVSTRQLEPYYNFPVLLEAASRLLPRIGSLRYLIAGEGSARANLEAASRRMGLEKVVSFTGPVARDRLPALVRSAHVYVSAVPTDGTSMSLLEAMAAGLVPVVADNDSNRHWITDREGGRLVPANDPGSYAEAIEEAWNDPALRKRTREINREVIRARASWRRNMAAFAQAYRDLVAGRPVATAGPAAQERIA